MARIVVPSAQALVTALGSSAREAMVTLAKALAVSIQETNGMPERRGLITQFMDVCKSIDAMDRADAREARQLARAEAAMDWMARRDEERSKAANARAAAALAKLRPQPGPASAIVGDLRAAREAKVRRQERSA